jgi:hypothetical protein
MSAVRPEWVPVFTGLTVRQFGKLVRIVAARGSEQTGTGRRWGLSLTDRVLLVAVYYRTNLAYRQVALLFGISKSAAGRIVEYLARLLVLSPVKIAHGPDNVLIVGGTLVPTHDRSVSASVEPPRAASTPLGTRCPPRFNCDLRIPVYPPVKLPGDGGLYGRRPSCTA